MGLVRFVSNSNSNGTRTARVGGATGPWKSNGQANEVFNYPPTVIIRTGADRTVFSVTLPGRIPSDPRRPVDSMTTTSILFAATRAKILLLDSHVRYGGQYFRGHTSQLSK